MNTLQTDQLRRRGSAYLLVVALVTFVLLAGLAASATLRVQSRASAQTTDVIRAETLAESAVSWALAKLAADANWRTTYSSGVEVTPISFGGGTISFKLVDESDGNLANNQTHSVRIYGYGRAGKATKVLSVLASGKDALTCLNAAVTTGGDLNLNKVTAQASGFTLASNGNVLGTNASTANANVEAVGTVATTINGTGTRTNGVAARGMPDSNVFDYYLANGSWINYSAISNGAIEGMLISPLSCPFLGTLPNSLGIYVIDCKNKPIVIKNSRIVGTLVLLNPGSGSKIGDSSGSSGGINWSPAVRNFPCLLVKGDIQIAFAAQSVSESLPINFNLIGTPYPYPNGSTDLDFSDSYPSIIDGLVYVSGNLSGNNAAFTVGQYVVGGVYDASVDTITFKYSSTYLSSPPPGFRGGNVQPASGTWRWEEAP